MTKRAWYWPKPRTTLKGNSSFTGASSGRGKTALVTGATSNIGRAIAEAYGADSDAQDAERLPVMGTRALTGQ
ncbi:hypothetical protein AB0H77_42155 [Streptomyces sp. NPDC050844]|uniref:hypothetical protein n=1 Tax=Streptomyces sp. NPDC050844 TaxID=3155790 RepID=UPI0033EE2584